MPRAYIDTILSSKPGSRRRYLAISCGSKVDRRSRGTSRSIFAVGERRLPAVAVAAVRAALGRLALEVVVHLRVQRPLRERPLQLVDEAVLAKRGLRITAGQEPVQQLVRDHRRLASCHARVSFSPSSWP